jgi:transcriptional regulator with XRE-family HTH domain
MFTEGVQIVNRLEELRLRRGWNATEAAEKLGFPKTTYYNYEKGNRQLYPEQLIKIADFYGVSIDYLLGRDDRTVVIRSPLDEKYEALDERGRRVVEAVIDAQSAIDLNEYRMVARSGHKLAPDQTETAREVLQAMEDDE